MQLTTLNNEVVYMFGYGDATSSGIRAAMSKVSRAMTSHTEFTATQQTRALTRELGSALSTPRH